MGPRRNLNLALSRIPTFTKHQYIQIPGLGILTLTAVTTEMISSSPLRHIQKEFFKKKKNTERVIN